MKRWLQKLAGALVFLLAAALVARFAQVNPPILGTSQTLGPGYYRVVEVYDGDTIAVDMGGTVEKVRLIGVDTPETHHPKLPVQCFGYAATDFTRSLIGNNPVRLEADPLSSNRDRYDRLLRYVYLPDGTLVNRAIVERGYGFAYIQFEFSKAPEFTAAEAAARGQVLGLWSNCPANQS